MRPWGQGIRESRGKWSRFRIRKCLLSKRRDIVTYTIDVAPPTEMWLCRCNWSLGNARISSGLCCATGWLKPCPIWSCEAFREAEREPWRDELGMPVVEAFVAMCHICFGASSCALKLSSSGVWRQKPALRMRGIRYLGPKVFSISIRIKTRTMRPTIPYIHLYIHV